MLSSLIGRIRPLSGCVCKVPVQFCKGPVVKPNLLLGNLRITSGIFTKHDRSENLSKEKIVKDLSQEEKENEVEKELDGLSRAGMNIPSEATMDSLVGGIPFKELPVANIRASPNNTIIGIYDFTGKTRYSYSSAGIEGYRNSRKRSEVAAQETGVTAGLRAKKKGVDHVRVVVKGLGKGRLPAIKGLQMAGMNIVSLTDNTPIFTYGPKPGKVRRL